MPNVKKDIKSGYLRSPLQGKPSPIKQPSEEADGQPPAKRKKIDLIFKDIIEASLEDSIPTRSQSLLSSECKIPLGLGSNSSDSSFNIPNLRVEKKEEENQTSEEPTTSFCPNCVKLKNRVLELEAELSRLGREKGNVAGPQKSDQAQHYQLPSHPEQGETVLDLLLCQRYLILYDYSQYFVTLVTDG